MRIRPVGRGVSEIELPGAEALALISLNRAGTSRQDTSHPRGESAEQMEAVEGDGFDAGLREVFDGWMRVAKRQAGVPAPLNGGRKIVSC
jgi:hypothetical protein